MKNSTVVSLAARGSVNDLLTKILRAFAQKLEDFGAMEYTIVVSATASDPEAMQFWAPIWRCDR